MKTKAEELMGILANVDRPGVVNTFAELMRNGERASGVDDMKEELSEADRKLREEPRIEERDIAELDDSTRATMATLALLGYSFTRGKFYWRVVSPEGAVIDSLQPSLFECVMRASSFNATWREHGGRA